jgi:hypothetical protein
VRLGRDASQGNWKDNREYGAGELCYYDQVGPFLLLVSGSIFPCVHCGVCLAACFRPDSWCVRPVLCGSDQVRECRIRVRGHFFGPRNVTNMLVTREDTGATLYEGCWFDGRQTGPAACVFDNDRFVLSVCPAVVLVLFASVLRAR